jgi:hypothetical protein
VPPELIASTSQTLTAANGTPIPTLGEATVSFSIGAYTTTITGLVSDHIVEVMLGIEWLTTNKAVWDFAAGCVYLNGVAHRLRDRRGEKKWCRRVVLEDTTEIPARSEAILPTKIVFRPQKEAWQDEEWGTEPAMLAPGVHVSRTIVPNDRVSNIPVRVVNVLSEPVRLNSGLVVADLQPLSVVCLVINEASLRNARESQPGDAQKSELVMGSEDSPQINQIIDAIDPSLPEGIVIELRKLLHRYETVFSTEERDLGRTNIVTHRIDTGDARPVRQQLRRFPPAQVKAISEHVQSMLEQGVIEPACSPWASNGCLYGRRTALSVAVSTIAS